MGGVLRAPTDAPANVVRACESEAQALRVSLRARGHTDSWYAKALKRADSVRSLSRSYFSELTTGKKRIPDWMIAPICVLTGTNLLAQYRAWQRKIALLDQAETEADRDARIAAELRRAA
jgi:hypothetical protein